MDDFLPVDFEVYVGSFGGRAFGAWWDGERIVYESFEAGYQERQQVLVTPSPAQWRRFWHTVDELAVWQWSRRYDPSNRFEPASVIRDGTHWSLTLAHGVPRIESSGDCTGPDTLDLDESPVFGRFLEAVSRLLGGREFA